MCELTPGERRVALTPHAVYELTKAGHRVYIEVGGGGGALGRRVRVCRGQDRL